MFLINIFLNFLGKKIDSLRLFVPHKLNKIQLTPSRSRFIVIGTKDSIFNWMEYYETLICEFSSLHLNRTTIAEDLYPILRFELHDDEGQANNQYCNIMRKLFLNGIKKYHGSSKMRLEISINNNNTHTSELEEQLHCKNQTPVMEVNCKSGTRLLHVLNKWYNYRISNNNKKLDFEQMKKNCDYELQ